MEATRTNGLDDRIIEWMKSSAPTFPFAQSLYEQWQRRGFLSVRQIEAANKCIEARAKSAEQKANAPEASLKPLEDAFNHALARGAKRAAMVVGNLRFSLAGPMSANPGAIYAKERSEGVYLGKFASGRFFRSRDCTDEQQAALLEIASDPLKKAIEHGRMTGECAVCSRELTDPESIARGIGPVCADKFGW